MGRVEIIPLTPTYPVYLQLYLQLYLQRNTAYNSAHGTPGNGTYSISRIFSPSTCVHNAMHGVIYSWLLVLFLVHLK